MVFLFNFFSSFLFVYSSPSLFVVVPVCVRIVTALNRDGVVGCAGGGGGGIQGSKNPG